MVTDTSALQLGVRGPRYTDLHKLRIPHSPGSVSIDWLYDKVCQGHVYAGIKFEIIQFCKRLLTQAIHDT